jgi:hypothetical protein
MNSQYSTNFLGIEVHSSSELGFTIVIGILFVIYLATAIWCVRDARRRGKSRLVAFLFITAAGWPLSALFWLWLRPETNEEREKRLSAAKSHDCPKCGTYRPNFGTCPNCQWSPSPQAEAL